MIVDFAIYQSTIQNRMHMERLVKTFSFRVLSSNESSADKQRNATDNLIKEIIKLNTEENDNIFVLRILRYTRFRLQSLQEKPSSDRAGEKCGRAIVCHLYRTGTVEYANTGVSSCFARQTSQETPLDRQSDRFS